MVNEKHCICCLENLLAELFVVQPMLSLFMASCCYGSLCVDSIFFEPSEFYCQPSELAVRENGGGGCDGGPAGREAGRHQATRLPGRRHRDHLRQVPAGYRCGERRTGRGTVYIGVLGLKSLYTRIHIEILRGLYFYNIHTSLQFC